MNRDHSRRHSVVNQSERAPIKWFAVDAKVQVRVKDPAHGSRWVDGLVKATAQGGAFVQVSGGIEGFFYFRDIQGMPKKRARPPSDLTTRIPGWKSSPAGLVNPRPVTSAPTEEAEAPAISPVATPMGPIGRTETGEPTDLEEARPVLDAPAMGEEIAMFTSPQITPGRGNTIEDILARANENNQSPEQEESTMTEHKPQISRIGLAEVSSAAADQMSFEEFLECLCELVVIPMDRDTRKRWLSLARELHAMTLC